MKPASLKEIKTELSLIQHERLLDLCVRLAKYNKDNKELLSYLLFEEHDEQAYIQSVTAVMDEQFQNLNADNLYLAKKTVRKVLRTANKFIKYSGSKQTEVDILLYFCKKLKQTGLPFIENTALGNIYNRQVLKITTTISKLHEDLQYDYSKEIELL